MMNGNTEIIMKKLLLLILTFSMFAACSSDDDGPEQDYTSFVFFTPEDITFPNCVVGYKKDGKYYKISDLGDLTKNVHSKEVTLSDKSIKELYLFSDYNANIRFDAIYSVKEIKPIRLSTLNNTSVHI